MHLDPHFQEFSIVILFLLFSGLVAKVFQLPNAIGFLLSGVLVGPSVLGVVDQTSAVNQIGSAGVVLLLFFLGMEMSPKEIVKEWRVTVLGTVIQIAISVLLVIGIGHFFDWPMSRSILIGFVISLSSTVMVIKILQDKNLTQSPIGKDTLGILITQDILVVPMLIIVGMMGDSKLDGVQLIKQSVGVVFLIGCYLYIPRLPFFKSFLERIKNDLELQVLFCLSFAFGIALISGALELSTALGAFIAGGIISQMNVGELFHKTLYPMKLILNAVFFSTIGILLDVKFLLANPVAIVVVTVAALLSNTLINAGILVMLGRKWRNSLVASAFLSQIGEFSFILAAIGMQQKVINEFAYQFTILIIFLSILVTPIWIKLVTSLAGPEEEALRS